MEMAPFSLKRHSFFSRAKVFESNLESLVHICFHNFLPFGSTSRLEWLEIIAKTFEKGRKLTHKRLLSLLTSYYRVWGFVNFANVPAS